MLRTIGTCHCPFFCLVQRIHRVGKGFSVTRDGSQIISVMRDRAQINRVIRHSSVMREISLLLRDTWFSFEISVMVKWLISMETRSRDIKNTKLWDKLLALFSRFSTSDFFRSSDNRMLVNVVNILNYLSVMRDRYPPPRPPCHPVFNVLPEDYFCALLPFESWDDHNVSLFNSKQRSAYLVLFLLNILTHYPACCSTEG